MIDPRKVRLMTKLAVYEDSIGRQELKINRYSKKTYVNIKQLVSMVAITAAYVLGVTLYCFGIYTKIIGQGLKFPWKKYLLGAAVLYFVVFLINFIIVRRYYSRVYDRMRENIKEYDRGLYRLEKYISRAKEGKEGKEAKE